MYKIKRFGALDVFGPGRPTLGKRLKFVGSAAVYGGVAGAIPGTILGFILGGAAGLISRNKGWAKKGAKIGGALTGLAGASLASKLAWDSTDSSLFEIRDKEDEKIMEKKMKMKYPKESSSTIIKAIKDAEKVLGLKFPDQLYKLATVQADFNNEYYAQWERIEARSLFYPNYVPQICLEWSDYESEYKDVKAISLLSGADDGGDWLYWFPESDQYEFVNYSGSFKSIKDAMLSYLDYIIKLFNKWINKEKNDIEKDRLRKYLAIITEYRFRISRL